MRRLITRLLLPLSLISFACVTKWWYALVHDGPDVVLYGFPLAYKCARFSDPLADQYFLIELFADLAFYFLILFLLIYSIWRNKKFRVPNTLSVILWVIALTVLLRVVPDPSPQNRAFSTRPFEMEVWESGIMFIWQDAPRPKSPGYQKQEDSTKEATG